MTKSLSRSSYIVITYLIVRPMDCGSTSSWAQIGQTLGTGQLVGALIFELPVRWANVKQAMHGQRRECYEFLEHSNGPRFLETTRVRLMTLETGLRKFITGCTLILCVPSLFLYIHLF